jgi:hypothetical protein
MAYRADRRPDLTPINTEGPLLAAGSTGQRNTLIFCQKMECGHETATSHLLLGGSAV